MQGAAVNEKTQRLAEDIAAGRVIEKPACECGWRGKSPAVLGAGCPDCGTRLGSAELGRLAQRLGELQVENEQLRKSEKALAARVAELESQRRSNMGDDGQEEPESDGEETKEKKSRAKK